MLEVTADGLVHLKDPDAQQRKLGKNIIARLAGPGMDTLDMIEQVSMMKCAMKEMQKFIEGFETKLQSAINPYPAKAKRAAMEAIEEESVKDPTDYRI